MLAFGGSTIVAAMLMAQLALAPGDIAPPGRDIPLAAELGPQVERLLRQLRSESAQQRQQAEEALIQLGPDVLDHLPLVTEQTPAELKLRLGRIRQVLQRQLADRAGKASLVTLQGSMPLSQALEALQQQTGNTVYDYRESFGQQPRNVTVQPNFQRTPFWEALDTLLDQADLTVYPFADRPGVALVARDETEIPRKQRGAVYAGPFRLEIAELAAQRNIRQPDQQRLHLQMEVAWEPRLQPIHVHLPIDSLAAWDDTGSRLAHAGSATPGAEIVPGSTFVDFLLPFELPPRNAQRIARLQGKLVVLAPGRMETFRFEKLRDARNVSQRLASATVVLERVRKNNEAWECRVLVRFDDAAGALESFRGWVFNNEAYLEDAQGRRLGYDTFETTRHTDNEVGVAYYFTLDNDAALDQLALIYKTPSVILTLTTDFEFRDLPLP
jgi:hypothetical protein